MDHINSDKENRAMLEKALTDFLERQPIEGHTFQMVQSDSANMTYVVMDRFFSIYRIVGFGQSYIITGIADNGSSYIPTYGDDIEAVYKKISSLVPTMNLAPETDGRLCYRKEGMFNPEFLDFDYTFRNVVYNVEAYRKSAFEGMTDNKARIEPIPNPDENIDRQIRKFVEMSDSDFVKDRPEKGEYIIRSPEGIVIEYHLYGEYMDICSELEDIEPRARMNGEEPFELYLRIQSVMPFSPVFYRGKLYYVSRDIGLDSPMRDCIMEQSFDCLAAHDAYRVRILDV